MAATVRFLYKLRMDKARLALDSESTKHFPWLLAYLVVVLLAHVLTIQLATERGGLVLVGIWFYAALLLFIPGFIIGAIYVFGAITHVQYPVLHLLFGLAAVALPLYEWQLLQTLPSGWGGR
jgi:hypothetical protein